MKHITPFSVLLCASLAVPQVSWADDGSFPKADQCYLLRPSQAQTSCIRELSDNSLYVDAYDAEGQCYWEFVPTENDNCFYIRNMTTGNYIQSTNVEASTAVGTGTEPVEFYVGENTQEGSSTKGYYFMSSTDNSTYNQVSENTKGLNRDGKSNVVVSYSCGSGNANSFWSFEEADYGDTAEDELPQAGLCYLLHPSQALASCVSEQSDKSLYVGAYDIATRCYWEFIPTGNDSCFYIRNVTTGNYIQSTNVTTSSAVGTGTEPVEFYVGRNSIVSSSVYGYWYMSSTDNSTYNQVSASTKGLNRSGTAVVSYPCGSGNVNSFWRFEETDYEYDAQPFTPAASIGEADYTYSVSTPSGLYLTASAESNGISLQAADSENHQSWYFVGTSNSEGGFLIVSSENNAAIGEGNSLASDTVDAIRWCVYEVSEGGSIYYVFRAYGDEAGNALTVDGDSLFTFSHVDERSAYMQSIRVYNMPCGSTSTAYLRELGMEGDAVLHPITYPIGTLASNGKTIQHVVSKPTSVYDLFTKDRGVVARGEEFTLSATVYQPDGFDVYAYFDWNGDGIFETSYTLVAASSSVFSAAVAVPDDAVDGATRMRIRITDNELPNAEDDTNGQVQDFVIYAEDAPEALTVEVTSSDLTRGTVSIDPESDSYESGSTVTVTATRLGNGLFRYWAEGQNVVSSSATYEFTVDRPVKLVAHFKPNTRGTSTGIDEAIVKNVASAVDINLENKVLVINTDEAVKTVQVYDVKGALVAQSASKRVSLDKLPAGTYVVNAITTQSYATAKIFIR